MAPVLAIANLVADRRRRGSTRIVTPLERLTHPSPPGRTWSHAREEHQYGSHVSTEPEATESTGQAASVRRSWFGGDASACGRDRRRQQRALCRGPSGSGPGFGPAI